MPINRKAMGSFIAAAVAKLRAENPAASIALVQTAATTAGLKYMADRFDELERRVLEQEKRLDAGPYKYMGVFTEGVAYSKGNMCTHDGSMWIANRDTRERPGAAGYEWTLCVKRGKDGKDAP